MLTDGYTVRLEQFEGPLDLLLYLIRRAEVDVTDIPIGRITDQYVEYLRGIERIDIELAGDFLVMAATLMEIKSRMLMPAETAQPTGMESAVAPVEKEDPRADLVRQLLAYKRFRDAASSLEQRHREWEGRFPGVAAGVSKEQAVEEEGAVEVEDLELLDIVRAFATLLETVDMERVGEHHIAYDETPIELHAADLLDFLRRDRSDQAGVEFSRVFSGRTRSEMVGLFLAMLELVRQRRIAVRQERIGDPIRVLLSELDDAAASAGRGGESVGAAERGRADSTQA
ncbi:MAG: segregation/condensation protein A [Phycisphaerae bacterium]|nr:segregation/condensation protein A [Phycisphaerae bacterium]